MILHCHRKKDTEAETFPRNSVAEIECWYTKICPKRIIKFEKKIIGSYDDENMINRGVCMEFVVLVLFWNHVSR